MQVRNVLIDTHSGYANKPTFIVEVDVLPDPAGIYFSQRGGLYFGYDTDGYVRFYSFSQPGNGYGGSTFTLNMTDGTRKKLKGPWSSRAGVMNKVGFPDCVDVLFKSHIETMHGHILAETLSMHVDMKKVETEDGEYTYEPNMAT